MGRLSIPAGRSAFVLMVLLVFWAGGGPSAHAPRWRRVDVGFYTIPMQSIYAFDTLHIWASTYFGDVLYSKNGSLNWNSFSLDSCCPPLAGGYANSFFFLDTLNGWMTGSANNYPPPAPSFRMHTRDGGRSWVVQLDTGSNSGEKILFLNSRRGFDVIGNACGFKDSFLVTNDSGNSWQARATGIPACRIENLNFVDSLNG